jgi:hypothetical protein
MEILRSGAGTGSVQLPEAMLLIPKDLKRELLALSAAAGGAIPQSTAVRHIEPDASPNTVVELLVFDLPKPNSINLIPKHQFLVSCSLPNFITFLFAYLFLPLFTHFLHLRPIKAA